MMKKSLLFLFLLITTICFSQVGIGTPTPNNKSILDIESKTKGVLMPRLTTSERDAINPESSSDPNGVDGLLIYNTDTDCYNYWNRATLSWVSMCQSTVTCDPNTWSQLNINCSQYPTADNNIYNIGTNTNGYTITSSINVTKTGSYKFSIVSNNGVTYSTTGTFSATGPQNVTLTSDGGAPTSSPINFLVKANGATVCNYTKSATTPLSYSTTCSPTTPTTSSLNFTQGNAAGGTFTIPLTVTGTGDIPSFTGTQSGITLTTTAITGATSGNTALTVTISGTPITTGNITIPLTINGNTCNYTFTVNTPTAAFTCSSATVNGTYTVGTAVSASNTITLILNVTQTGNYPAMSYTAGGVTFSTPAGNCATIGSKTLTLSATGTPTAAGVNNLTASPSTLCAASYTANPSTAVFTCSSATVNGTYTVGTAVSASNTITLILNVTQAGNYPAMSYTAGGVTFSTPTGNFATIGSKTLTLSATGTPTTAGVNNLTANPSTLCTASYTATAPGTAALNCANASYKSGNVLVAGTNSTNLIYNLPYTAGNGGSYNQYTVASAGVTGLTATIDAGSFANGAGNLDVKITGTPTTSGNATFTIAFGGSNCSFTVPVLTNSTSFTSCIESSTFGRNVSTSGNTNFTFPGSKTVGINATPSGGLSGGSFCNPQQWFGDFYTGYCGVNMGSTANMRIGTLQLQPDLYVIIKK